MSEEKATWIQCDRRVFLCQLTWVLFPIPDSNLSDLPMPFCVVHDAVRFNSRDGLCGHTSLDEFLSRCTRLWCLSEVVPRVGQRLWALYRVLRSKKGLFSYVDARKTLISNHENVAFPPSLFSVDLFIVIWLKYRFYDGSLRDSLCRFTIVEVLCGYRDKRC